MFCYKCGQQIPDDSVFCSKCGTRVSGNSQTANDNPVPASHTLTIDRANQFYLINPAVKAVIDNDLKLWIDNGKCESVRLYDGPHTVEFSYSFRRAVVNIDMVSDTVIEIGWNRLTGKLMARVVK